MRRPCVSLLASLVRSPWFSFPPVSNAYKLLLQPFDWDNERLNRAWKDWKEEKLCASVRPVGPVHLARGRLCLARQREPCQGPSRAARKPQPRLFDGRKEAVRG